MRLTIVCLIASVLLPSVSRAQGPVFTVTPEESDVKFFVKASVAIEGQFSKWEATLTFPSTDATSGVLDVEIYADSVNTGSGMNTTNGRAKTSSMPNRIRTLRLFNQSYPDRSQHL